MVMHDRTTKFEVAKGFSYPCTKGMMVHNVPVPAGSASILVDIVGAEASLQLS